MTAVTRRASYGPTSPRIGDRGRETRLLILERAQHRFACEGFRSVSMDRIAEDVRLSKATLYQYFESKEAIFTELSAESGLRLLTACDDIAAFGPTVEGVDALAQWLTIWFEDTNRFGPLLLDWHIGLDPSSPLRALVTLFIELHTPRFAAHLERSGIKHEETSTALALHAIVEGFNYLRLAFEQTLSDVELLRGLIEFLQLALYPATPQRVLEYARRIELAALPPTAIPSVRKRQRPTDDTRPAPVKSAPTNILQAAASEFAARGFHATSVDSIARRAGVSRTTVYKHFPSRAAVLEAVTAEAVAVFVSHYARLGFAANSPQRHAVLRAWLQRNNELQEHYIGVSRVWIETPAASVEVAARSETATRTFGRSIAQWTNTNGVRYRGGTAAATLAVAALFNALPDIAAGHGYGLDKHALVRAQERLLCNAFGNGE